MNSRNPKRTALLAILVTGVLVLTTMKMSHGQPGPVPFVQEGFPGTGPATATSTPKQWTLMVYICADNDLETSGLVDVNEMERVGSSDQVNVVTMLDRIPDYDNADGDWTEARTYYVQRDACEYVINSPQVRTAAEANMSSPEELGAFVDWAKTSYPASKYALIVWDHGSGPLYGSNIGGICFDESSGNSYMDIVALRDCLAPASRHVDLLGIDACLMGSLEVYYELQAVADVLVGSELSVPGYGFMYDAIMEYLNANPAATAEQLGAEIVDSFFTNFPRCGTEVSLAAVRTSTLPALATAVNALSQDIMFGGATILPHVATARDRATHVDTDPFLDLYDFCEELRATTTNATIQAAATAVQAQVNATIIAEANSEGLPGLHGIDVYFPWVAADYKPRYGNYSLAASTLWDELIHETMAPLGEDDAYEDNDVAASAVPLTAGAYFNLRSTEEDYDYYTISASAGDTISVVMRIDPYSSADLDLFLYAPGAADGDALNSSESLASWEELSHVATTTGAHVLEVKPYDLEGESRVWYALFVGTSATDDAFEDNDRQATAVDLTGQVNTTLTGLQAHDVDYYKVNVAGDQLLRVSLTFDNQRGDLDVYLYDPDGQLVTGAVEIGIDDALWGTNITGYYTIKVVPYIPCANYALRVEVSAADDVFEDNDREDQATVVTPGTYANLVCYDEDYYSVSLTAGQWLNATIFFSHREGDLDLYLYRPGEEEAVASAGSTGENEELYYRAPETGTYLLHVTPYEINLAYAMAISHVNLTHDALEPNNDFDSAATIEFGRTYANLSAWDADIYAVEVPARTLFAVDLLFDVCQGDLDLYLVDEYMDLVDASGGFASNESVSGSSDMLGGGVYYIWVDNYEANPEYTLRTRVVGTYDIPAFPVETLALALVAGVLLLAWRCRRLTRKRLVLR